MHPVGRSALLKGPLDTIIKQAKKKEEKKKIIHLIVVVELVH